MKNGFRLFLGLFVGLVLFGQPLLALQTRVITSTLTPSGRGANANFYLINDSTEMLAVEVYLQKRDIDPKTGGDILSEIKDEFLVYPNQFLLRPGEEKMSTVTWIGREDIESELAYRLVFEQLDMNLGDVVESDTEVKGGVKALVKIMKSLYVNPAGSVSKCVVSSSKKVKMEDGQNGIEFVISNIGSRHKLLKQTKLFFAVLDNKKMQHKKILKPAQLAVVNMLPSLDRVFVIPWPNGMPDGQFDVQLIKQ